MRFMRGDRWAQRGRYPNVRRLNAFRRQTRRSNRRHKFQKRVLSDAFFQLDSARHPVCLRPRHTTSHKLTNVKWKFWYFFWHLIFIAENGDGHKNVRNYVDLHCPCAVSALVVRYPPISLRLPFFGPHRSSVCSIASGRGTDRDNNAHAERTAATRMCAHKWKFNASKRWQTGTSFSIRAFIRNFNKFSRTNGRLCPFNFMQSYSCTATCAVAGWGERMLNSVSLEAIMPRWKCCGTSPLHGFSVSFMLAFSWKISNHCGTPARPCARVNVRTYPCVCVCRSSAHGHSHLSSTS